MQNLIARCESTTLAGTNSHGGPSRDKTTGQRDSGTTFSSAHSIETVRMSITKTAYITAQESLRARSSWLILIMHRKTVAPRIDVIGRNNYTKIINDLAT